MDDIERLLPPAIAVMTAWLDIENDPDPFWRAVERALADITAPEDDAERAYAYLVCGLCALCEIIIANIARPSGMRPEEVLEAIRRSHIDNA
jgi:hypothetical protein